MLADPVTVAAATPTPELKFAISSVNAQGTERIDTNGGGFTIVTQHTKLKRGGSRHYVQISRTRDAVDPYSGLTRKVVASASFTLYRPTFGFSDAELIALAKALTDYRDDTEVTTARLLQFQA